VAEGEPASPSSISTLAEKENIMIKIREYYEQINGRQWKIFEILIFGICIFREEIK